MASKEAISAATEGLKYQRPSNIDEMQLYVEREADIIDSHFKGYPEAREALELAEWSVLLTVRSGDSDYLCPVCNNYKIHGHADNCKLNAALKLMGGTDGDKT